MSLFVSVDKDQREVIVELENIQKTYLLGIEGVPALRGVSTSISHFKKKI
jgi:putative ABC transport system ATP-binding protein